MFSFFVFVCLSVCQFKKPKASSSSKTKKAKASDSKAIKAPSGEAGTIKKKTKVADPKKKTATNKKKAPTSTKEKKVGSKNPFIIFCSETRPLLPPDVTSFGDKQKRLSSMWKELNDEQREAYRARSVALAATDGSA